jgi:hypothetical protein
VFYEGDVEDILKIPVGRAGTGNYVAWNYTKNGIFSVKSAYHLNMHFRSSTGSRGGPSLSLEEHQDSCLETHKEWPGGGSRTE